MFSQVLLINLIRHTNDGARTFRLGHRISLPSVHSLRPGSQPYRLTGILLHDGHSLQSGHYTAVTRCVLTGQLFCSNDAFEPTILGAARLREVEEQAYILVYSLEAATREAAAQVQEQGLFGASQEPMEVSSGPGGGGQGDCFTPHKMDLDTDTDHGQKRGEDFTPRQRVKLQMTASSVSGGCPGCAAEVQGHQCQEAGARASLGTSGQDGGSSSGVQQQTSPSRPSSAAQEWEWAAGMEWELEPLDLNKSSNEPHDNHLAGQGGRGRGSTRGQGVKRGQGRVRGQSREQGAECDGEGGGRSGRGAGQGGHAARAARSAKKRNFTDNFQPSDEELEKITAGLEEREVYLRERLARLQQDDFSWAGLPPNPLHSGIIEMERKLQELTFQYCRHCDELLLGEKLTPRDQRCVRCNVAWQHSKPGQVLMWSQENDLHCTPVPPELQDLTPVEQSAIQRIFVIMKIYRLARGAIHLKGHCLGVLQDLQGFALRLPPAPSNLPMVFLIGPGQKVGDIVLLD
jgi:hypothetical protein